MRRLTQVIAGVALAGGLALATPAFAGAAGYPPPPSNTGSGSAVVGGSVSGTATGFAFNTLVSFPGGSGTSNSSGNFTFTINVTDAQSPHYSINGGVAQAGVYGANTIDFTGASTSPGVPHTFIYTLTITRVTPAAVITPAKPVTPAVVTPAATTQPSSGLALTGADIAMTVGGGLVLIVGGGAILLAVSRRRTARES